METERMTILGWWALIRWFMVTVLFSIGMLHISFFDKTVESVVFLGVFFGIVALNLLFQMQVRFKTTIMQGFQIVLDLVFATMVVHLTGGPTSHFVWIYVMAVITASLTIPRYGGITAGLMGSLFLLILMVLYQNGVIQPNNMAPLDVTGATVYILSYTGLFCGVAFIASFLNDQLRLTRQSQATIDRLNDDISRLKEDFRRADEFRKEVDELLYVLKDVAHLDHDINTPLCVISLSISRVKKIGMELENENLKKTSNEITEAVNRISELLKKLDRIKLNHLVDYKRGGI